MQKAKKLRFLQWCFFESLNKIGAGTFSSSEDGTFKTKSSQTRERGENEMKKTLRSAVIFCTVLVTLAGFVGCKSELISQDSLVGYSENVNSTFSESVVLGKKIDNPFSLSKARSAGITESANYAYFRCRSNDMEKVEWLKNMYGELEIIPMDREVISGGTYYDDPDIDEGNECPWIYFMDTLDVLKSIEAQGFLTEVLEELFVSEDALSEIEEGYHADDEPECADGRWLFFWKYKNKA